MPYRWSQNRNKKLFCCKQHRTIFSQDGYPVNPSPPVAIRSATHFEARLWYVRWSLFSVTFLTLVEWAGHVRGVMVNMRRWGIVDLCLPPQRHSWKITLPLWLEWLLLHLTTQTRLTHGQSDCVNRCFMGENRWPLAPRSDRGVHVLCPRVNYYIVLLLYIWTKRHSWDWWKCFLFPHIVRFSTIPPAFPVSQRCFKSSAPLRLIC